MDTIDVIDSHTGGEPTRLIVSGGPELGRGPLRERVARFRAEFDHLRRAVTLEPRGSDVLVGALLCEPFDETCSLGVIFFNNVDYLGMCGHGTIGLVSSLQHLGQLEAGTHCIDTPAGKVTAELAPSGVVSVRNVESYRWAAGVRVEVPGLGAFVGDVAYGGNWFFLVHVYPDGLDVPDLDVGQHARWTELGGRIRTALAASGVTGEEGAYIDHVEFFGPPEDPSNDSRNFVLCPGGAFDRSPCGTGTSAKLACLAADGVLGPGERWAQESIIGSVFTGSYEVGPRLGTVLPTVAGTAFITARSSLVFDPRDPLRDGFGVPADGAPS